MKKFLQVLMAVAFLAGLAPQAMAQCNNTSPYGSATISSTGSAVQISSCSYAGEYSTISGAVSGQTLVFTSSAGDYITVRSGSSGGAVVAQGVSPLTFSNTFTGTLFAHWNTNSSCGTQNSCRTTTVQCTSCVPVPGQCLNSSSFGSATINSSGAVVTIASCSYAGEYSTISGAVAGQGLKFISSTAGDWITVRAGSVGGPVLASGTTPLSVANTFTGTLYVHWNTNFACGTQSTCRTTTVQCVSCVAPPAPSNDLCSGAQSISCGQTITGTNTNATADAPGFCGTSPGGGPGVWYKFIGNGGFATASTCGSGFDTKINVYSGNCTSLVCEGGNDDFCGLQSSVTWCSQAGTPYYILVSGYSPTTPTGTFSLNLNCTAPSISISAVSAQCLGNPSVTLSANYPGGTFSGPGVSGNTFNPAAAGVGTHTITYTVCSATATTTITVNAPAANDNCANAMAIGCNSSVSGSTTCSTPDTGLNFCGTTGGTAPGNWYTFTGNGGHISLSTCNSGTNYDTKLHVFSGSCGGLTCVDGNDDYSSTDQTCGVSSLRSIVEFCTEPGVTYYVLVSGFGSGAGNYQLDATCTDPLTVDAGACQTRFVGYTGAGAPNDTLFICPSISGGDGAYTTTISPAAAYMCDNGCFAVAPSANTTYTISVTDGKGCSTSDDVEVQVIDVVAACPSNGQPKVQICHVPPGNPGNANNICISPSAVAAHLAGGSGHGTCYLGPCGNTCRSTNAACNRPTCAGGTFTVTISGTGYMDETSWTFAGASGGGYSFGTSNSTTVTVPSGTASTFTLETQGSFNDNDVSYSISCGGNVILSGSLNGGLAISETGICCGAQIAPKTSVASKATGIIAFPNPFTEATTFKFRSASRGTASILIYNMAGQQVATAFNGRVEEMGSYEVNFNATGLTAGTYMYRYTNAEGKMSMGKINLVK